MREAPTAHEASQPVGEAKWSASGAHSKAHRRDAVFTSLASNTSPGWPPSTATQYHRRGRRSATTIRSPADHERPTPETTTAARKRKSSHVSGT
jgi:hypothetical protein